MTKTHFVASPTASEACGRTASSPFRRESVTRHVTCLACKKQPEFKTAQIEQQAAAQAAFEAQEPKTVAPQFGRTNAAGVMECQCGGTLFREKPRSLFSFHFVCSECGHSLHPLTETGMCT